LDHGYGVDAEAFVGGVQAGEGDAEPSGDGNAEAGEIITDVGWVGDLGFGVDAEGVGGLDHRGPQRRVCGQRERRPAGGDLDQRRLGVGPRLVHLTGVSTRRAAA